MIVIEFTVSKQNITLAHDPDVIASGSCKFIQFKFTFSAEWDGLTKIAKINTGGVEYLAAIEDDGTVSPENMPILQAGYCYIGVVGTKTDGTAATTVILQNPLRIKQGADSGGEIVVIEQTYGQQVLAAAAAAELAATEAMESASLSEATVALMQSSIGTTICPLNPDGNVPFEFVPAQARMDLFPISDESELVTLDAQKNDVAYILTTYEGEPAKTMSWILAGDDPTVRSNWILDLSLYAALAAHADTATTASNASKINGLNLVKMTQSEFDAIIGESNTVYIVPPDAGV